MPPRFFRNPLHQAPVSPHGSRRSILSPAAGWPAQEPAPVAEPPAAPRYSDEQRFALSCWACAWLRKAPAAQQVEALRHYPGLEPLYYRRARLALESQCPTALAAAAQDLWKRTLEAHDGTVRLRKQMPHLARFLRA